MLKFMKLAAFVILQFGADSLWNFETLPQKKNTPYKFLDRFTSLHV
jgi:hypothetical protein